MLAEFCLQKVKFCLQKIIFSKHQNIKNQQFIKYVLAKALQSACKLFNPTSYKANSVSRM